MQVKTRGIVLEMRGIVKSFGGVRALRGADLVAEEGEILGLCGENGAGKSTLLKVLSGVYPHGSYEGVVTLRGEPLRFQNTRDAARAGVAIVHQELMLVPGLSVAENLMLGREPVRFGFVDDARIEAHARELLLRFGVANEIDAAMPVGDLGIGLQQVVEIVRALSYDAKILVLDEPTAALTGEEADRLMGWLRDLRAKGTTSIYVSHRMDEVFALCDRITVLRDGKTEGTVVTSETPPGAVISMMVGREISGEQRRAPERSATNDVAIGVRDLRLPLRSAAKDEEGVRRYALDGISLSVRKGEVLAIAGAMGSGRTALLSALFGVASGEVTGTVSLLGAAVDIKSAREAIDLGIALLPEDRKGRGLVLGMTTAENLALPLAPKKTFWDRMGFIDAAAEELLAERRIRELKIKGDANALVSTLSGGNQQKVVLGKWLETPPKVLLLDEPTRGVDVGAREEIYGILEELTEKGVAILVASSDLTEVLRLAHRILVLRHGRIAGELDGRTASQEDIVSLSTGASTLAQAHGSVKPEENPISRTEACAH